jgi:hypothetical protein
VDGLIGADFFREHVVQIDYRAEKLRLLSRTELPAAAALPLVMRGDALCVRAAVNGDSSGWARVDTGCDATIEWVAATRLEKSSAGTSIAAAAGTHAATLANIEMGNLRLSEVPIGFRPTPIFAGESGLIGNGVLGRFTVTFDVARKRLWLTPR